MMKIICIILCAIVQTNTQTSGCLKQNYGRGVGTMLTPQCLSSEDAYGALCYPKCKTGYEAVGCCICQTTQGCPQGYIANIDNITCTKPASYGRGTGYPWMFGDPLDNSKMFARCEANNGKGNCELSGAIVYPKCKTGFHAVGCCVCSPDCPSAYTDIGAFCLKGTYGRGFGISRLGCSANQQQDASLCYQPCRNKFNGVGPVCWGPCSSTYPTDCGAICTKNSNECAQLILSATGNITTLVSSLILAGGSISVGNIPLGVIQIVQGVVTTVIGLNQTFNLPTC